MAAVTRWVQYDVSTSGIASDGNNYCKGTRGYTIGTASVSDTFTIGPTTNRLYISIDGNSAPYITLYSGSSLDPRFVAKDITEKLHVLGESNGYEGFKRAMCVWENLGSVGNRLGIYSGSLGSSSSITIVSGTDTAHSVLGFGSTSVSGGIADPNTFDGTVSISGTYYGLQSEIYKIIVSSSGTVAAPVKGGSNTYAGTMSYGGAFNYPSDISYTVSIDCTNGTTMGAGTGHVPTMSWVSTGSADDSSTGTELLYPDFWYKVGSKGLRVKFTDAVFNTCNPAWTVLCTNPDYAYGSNAHGPIGSAQYIYSSDRGDFSASPVTTVSGGWSQLGKRGLSIKFTQTGSDDLYAGDTFYVICSGPTPTAYNISSLNYGNVTVSTDSVTKCVAFEIESGAAQLSSVKFGLQNHGTFAHHNAGNSDTYFRFGTVGPGNPAGSAPNTGIEWYPNIAATDIDSDTPPTYLYATEDNMAVVATADASEDVGDAPYYGMISDPIWLSIRLGVSETGANSTINYRLYFDYA
jgi:hypothetical protein